MKKILARWEVLGQWTIRLKDTFTLNEVILFQIRDVLKNELA